MPSLKRRMKHYSENQKRKVILTWSERITPGVPAKAVNMALMEENKELRARIKELENEKTLPRS